ncbi:MAG: 6,7-dimethyl-8-ribityllumazine synthase [Methanomassiliicoccales archaeon]
MSSVRLAIVCAKFNGEITDKMLTSALDRAKKAGAEVVSVVRVPGAFDIPLFADTLASRQDVDAVVALGAIVTGETAHDEVIAHQLAHSLSGISLHFHKPVTLGVSGPKMSWEQATVRASEYAERAVDAALEMVSILRRVS